jgi:folate-binding protein YgfZ
MNANWKNFLQSHNATFVDDTVVQFATPDSERQIYPVAHLAVLSVSGKDADKFLQGQITCNVHDINANQSSLGAICNPKGRVITTFLLVKASDGFLLVMPKELLAGVQTRLQKYVLRSAVTLSDCSDSLCLLGVTQTSEQAFLASYEQDTVIHIHFNHRCLLIADVDKAMAVWIGYVAQGFQAGNSENWTGLDILAGIPWLNTATSEQFIPQMLNLDKLGGISLTKGCYTGQEIVARTHYLGKAKRALFIAQCQTASPEANASIIDTNGQIVGNVILAEQDKMLIVLQNTDTDTAQLRLKDYNQALITLLTVTVEAS